MSELSPITEVLLTSALLDDDPCLENMSAQATAILNAYMTGYGWLDGPTKKDCRGVAAALRAAADQEVELNVPFSMINEWETIKGSCASFFAAAEWGYKQALKDQQAIAAELENND